VFPVWLLPESPRIGRKGAPKLATSPRSAVAPVWPLVASVPRWVYKSKEAAQPCELVEAHRADLRTGLA